MGFESTAKTTPSSSLPSDGIIDFTKELANYYKDFLETDFHRGRKPRRTITLREDHLRILIDLGKYQSFENRVKKAISKAFKGNFLNIKKGAYTAYATNRMIEEIKTQISKIEEESIKTTIHAIREIVDGTIDTKPSDPEKSLYQCLERLSVVIRENIILPLVSNINDALCDLRICGEEDLSSFEEELCGTITDLIKSPISEAIYGEDSTGNDNALSHIEESLEKNEIVKALINLFDQLNTTDLFEDLNELERNINILDKKEFYLYFYDISFHNQKYPIFYIPIRLNKDGEAYEIHFESQVYINRKALEYIGQEHGKETGKEGFIEGISDRIIYLAEHQDDFDVLIDTTISNIAEHFSLNERVGRQNRHKWSRIGSPVTVSDACYIALFDKSDEAILNDYEDLLSSQADKGMLSGFADLVDKFVNKEPESFKEEILNDWDDLPVQEKLVSYNPIPLNEEQRKIMTAVRKNGCNYIVVEGPPGTGKSHTITAIVFDAILRDQSVLVLSDKKEALDVVEEKITDTMNKVRFSNNGDFQNPILRLGRAGNTYSKILSHEQLEEIRNHYRAVRKEVKKNEGLEVTLEKKVESLRNMIDSEIRIFKDLKIDDIDFLQKQNFETTATFLPKIIERETNGKLIIRPEFKIGNDHSLWLISYYLRSIVNTIDSIRRDFSEEISSLELFSSLSSKDIEALSVLTSEFFYHKNRLFGFLFNKNKLNELEAKCRNELHGFRGHSLQKNIDGLCSVEKILNHAMRAKPENISNIFKDIDYVELIFHLVKEGDKEIKFIKKCADEIDKYLTIKKKVLKAFNSLRSSNYYTIKKKEIEELVTTQVTYILDGRVIEFYDKQRNDASTLREIIRKKKKFPKDQFKKLKKAFPCILAGIRDYADYIPLEPGLFDLVIIDEASQVSIAQAFPAILRGNKIVVLGDRRQFSNVKSYHARKDINKRYMNRLEGIFRERVSTNISQLERFQKFNIKTSVLDFFEHIANFDIMLKKHFRGYKELISYSNKYFYNGTLQVMKIRGKNIDEVIKFSLVDHDGKSEAVQNTNKPEVDFIISELRKLKESGSTQTVGIITPHRNQQKLFMEEISKLPESDYYFKDMRLKIMTFDTCQGDEKDIIFYSMVATREDDKLRYIFVNDLKDMDLRQENMIKAQRLNVGFSRAKECIHFVLSKPVEDFSGAIGQALRHYMQTRKEASLEKDASCVDERSPMEKKVLNWFYQTYFWRKNRERTEIRPQFEIGKYLKQLDPTYDYPEYKVDFLLLHTDEDGHEHKIIIEYDGFEHFTVTKGLTENNYQYYLSEEDIYRQRVLEGYGYKFLRINKFNMGSNPIETLNKRIIDTIKENVRTLENNLDSPILDEVEETVSALKEGEMKECPKCGRLKSLADFYDPKLKTKYGRICNECKGITNRNSLGTDEKDGKLFTKTPPTCPRCGAKMVLRNGPYGKFYGCSRFPTCKATRNIGRPHKKQLV